MLGKTSNAADLLNSHGGTIVTAFPAPSLGANECASEAESEQIEIWPNWRNGERERQPLSLTRKSPRKVEAVKKTKKKTNRPWRWRQRCMYTSSGGGMGDLHNWPFGRKDLLLLPLAGE